MIVFSRWRVFGCGRRGKDVHVVTGIARDNRHEEGRAVYSINISFSGGIISEYVM